MLSGKVQISIVMVLLLESKEKILLLQGIDLHSVGAALQSPIYL